MNPKILILDNYDSFTYNLVHLVRDLGYADQMDIFRNDKIDLSQIARYDKIILSPGPGLPRDAGIMPELIHQYAPIKSILGVCLGHQAIAEAFGGRLLNMPIVLHGVTDTINVIADHTLFDGLPKQFSVCRYHSWTVIPDSINDSLEVTVRDQQNNIMAIRHTTFDVHGVQFHPESVMTEYGRDMIANWLKK